MDARAAAANALGCVLEARPGERLMVICDDEKRPIGEAFSSAGLDMGLYTRLVMQPATKETRKEIPPLLEAAVIEGRPDIFVNLMRGGSDETPFRIALTRLEKRRRVRLGHCPGITLDMLTDGALALTADEYGRLQETAVELMSVCQGATGVRIRNPEGTDLRFSVEGREFFTDTRLNWQTLKWMNLPVGEVIVGPEESSAEGTLVCTTAVGGVGILKKPITLDVKGGKVQKIQCAEARAKAAVETAQSVDAWASRIGEFAFGLNTHARMMEEFLETEKMAGTVHVAFGNNADYPGGRNISRTHMDFLISAPTVTLEIGAARKVVVRDGKFVYK
jgi:leucyl aminopeptidase (aminopeptidase T)